ncbi:capsular polysaccharide synthesis protein [Photobacterium ganghwense]|uniref:capsular polysaccharide synthesis protein n=1 Tax=Photobacterium ganghwense TaxID=320778 RepID=UPI0040577983
MGKLNRHIKEHVRRIKCRFKKKPVLTEEQLRLAERAKAQMSEVMPLGEFSKTVWMFWDSGLENAPEVVKLSYRTWVNLNPDYTVVLLDNQNIQDYLGFDFSAICSLFSVDLGAAGKSDLLRLYLLNRFGGVWADATTFCKKPLSQWLDIDSSGFFAFREKFSDDRTLVSWFLVSTPGNSIVQALLLDSLQYLLKPRKIHLDIVGLKSTQLIADGTGLLGKTTSGYPLLEFMENKSSSPYFWMFYLFNDVVRREENITLWQSVLAKTNCYAELDEDFPSYEESYVSKQTYRDKYTATPLYIQRRDDIKEMLSVFQ